MGSNVSLSFQQGRSDVNVEPQSGPSTRSRALQLQIASLSGPFTRSRARQLQVAFGGDKNRRLGRHGFANGIRMGRSGPSTVHTRTRHGARRGQSSSGSKALGQPSKEKKVKYSLCNRVRLDCFYQEVLTQPKEAIYSAVAPELIVSGRVTGDLGSGKKLSPKQLKDDILKSIRRKSDELHNHAEEW